MRKNKKAIAMFIVIVMLMSNFVMLLKNVSIAVKTDVTVVITADSDSSISLSEDKETLTYTCNDNSTYSFNLKQGDTNIAFTKVTEEADGRYYDSYVASNISSNENLFITCQNIDLSKLDLMYNGNPAGIFDGRTLSLNQIEDVNHYQFRIESSRNNGNQGNTNSSVSLKVNGEELEYHEGSEEACDISFGINGSPHYRLLNSNTQFTKENGEIVGLQSKEAEEIRYNYDSNNNNNTVTFNMHTQWDDVITSLKINGQAYLTPQTKETLINSFRKEGRAIFFDVTDVPYAESYTVEVVGRKQTIEEKIMGNFGWNYDHLSQVEEDDKIPNGTLQFVKATYNNVTYSTPEEVNAAGQIYQWEDAEKKASYSSSNDRSAFGEAMFPVGTELTVRLVPDSGYQLTEFTLNGSPFTVGEEVGVYTFTITGGNFHLGAHFTEVNNEVSAEADDIKSGSIELNSNEQSFAYGTAKLDVDNVENLSRDRINEFEKTADEEGYNVENYLDLSLYNTVYKGGVKDEKGNFESWDTQVEKLNKKAKITLELEENMRGKDLVIVHETHNNNEVTGYELIEAEYNERDNTITFETDSFSNYAIATKDKTESEGKKYIINLDGFTVEFIDEEGHNFKVTIMDLWNLTKEQKKEFDISEEEYVKVINMLKENLKKYGTILELYDISIEDGRYIHTGETLIKIKITDEMKEYNTFKLVNIDEEDFSIKDVIELKIEGDYLVGTVPHLSVYALVGDNVSQEKSDNPKTGDNILVYASLFFISTFGMVAIKRFNKKK